MGTRNYCLCTVRALCLAATLMPCGAVGAQYGSDSTGVAACATDTTQGDTLAAVHDLPRVHTLDRIVVTDDRRRQLLQASQALSVIRPEEWIGTNKSVADVIAEQTGIQTRRYGGSGSFQTVSIRGVQGENVLVLLDGIALNSVMGGAVDLGAISPERIGEIEVYRGITPTEFGGGLAGGVINLKSKTAPGGELFNARAALGAYGYRSFGLEAGRAFGDRVDIYTALGYVASRNDWPYLDRNNTPYNPDDDTVRAVENHEHSAFEARIHPSVELAGGRSVVSGVSYSVSHTGIPGYEGRTNKTARHEKSLFTATARLVSDMAAGRTGITVDPEIGYVRSSEKTFWTSHDSAMGLFYGSTTLTPGSWSETQSDLDIVHLSAVARLKRCEWLNPRAVIQGRHSQIGSQWRVAGTPGGDWPGNGQELSVGSDLSAEFPAGQFILGATAGGGVKVVRSATEGGYNAMLVKTVEKSDTVTFPWNVRAGLHAGLREHLIAFTGIGRYSRTPSLREKYGANGAVIPNPDLREESGVTAQGGIRIQFPAVQGEAVAFRTQTRDGIVMLVDAQVTRPVNIGASCITGVEASVTLIPVWFARAQLRATFQDAQNRSRLYSYFGNKLPNEPDLSLFAKLQLGPFKGVELGYWLDYKSAFYRDYANTWRVPGDPDKPGLLFHNAQISWKTSRHIDVSVSIRNMNSALLNYEEMTHTAESGYSWTLYPANEWCATVRISL